MGLLEESRIEVSLVTESVLAEVVRAHELDPDARKSVVMGDENVEIALDVLGALRGFPFPPVFPPVWITLPFVMQHQQQTQWCWAATSVSVALYYRATSGWTQCEMANLEKGQTTCCQDGSTAQCNAPNVLNSPLNRAGVLDHMVGGTVEYSVVGGQVFSGRPLPLRIGWSGGGGHFIAIRGLTILGGAFVAIGDPWYGSSDISFSTLFGSYKGSGTWTHTYFTKPQTTLSVRPVRIPRAVWDRIRERVVVEGRGG